MNDINFLPESFRNRRDRRARMMRQSLMLVAVGLLMGLWWYRGNQHLASLQAQELVLEQSLDLSRDQVKQADQLRARRDDLRQTLTLQRELTPPVNGTQITALIASLMPPSMALSELRMGVENMPLARAAGESAGGANKPAQAASLKPPTCHVMLAAIAPSDMEVANFVGGLTSHTLFTNVKLVHSRSLEIGALQARECLVEMDVRLDCRIRPLSEVPQEVTRVP